MHAICQIRAFNESTAVVAFLVIKYILYILL